MPAPTSHTEGTLLTLMEDEVGPTGDALGLLVTDALLLGLYTVERLLGVAVASVLPTDMQKLETLARWQAWRAAKAAATGQFDMHGSIPGLKRSQTWDHIVAMYAEAEAAALVYDEVAAVLAGGNVAYVSGISTGGNPYQWPLDEWA